MKKILTNQLWKSLNVKHLGKLIVVFLIVGTIINYNDVV
jgi:hypothetical protein